MTVTRGRKAIPTKMKRARGTLRHGRSNSGEPIPPHRPKPPVPLNGRPLALWRRFITTAWWLTGHDAPKAWLWCHLHAEAERDPAAFTAAKLSQLRSLGSELGMDPAARQRMPGEKPAKKTPGEELMDP